MPHLYLVEITDATWENIRDAKPHWKGLFMRLADVVDRVTGWIEEWIEATKHTEIAYNGYNPDLLPRPHEDITEEALAALLAAGSSDAHEQHVLFQHHYGHKWSPAMRVTIEAVDIVEGI